MKLKEPLPVRYEDELIGSIVSYNSESGIMEIEILKEYEEKLHELMSVPRSYSLSSKTYVQVLEESNKRLKEIKKIIKEVGASEEIETNITKKGKQ